MDQQTPMLSFFVHFSLSSALLVYRSVSVYFWALTLFLFFIFLHVARHLSSCFPYEFSPTYSVLCLSLFSVFLPPFCPLRLSHSAIADTLYFCWILGRKDICVCFTIYESVYICFYIRVSVFTLGEQWLNSLSFVFLARPGGVWQWTKC